MRIERTSLDRWPAAEGVAAFDHDMLSADETLSLDRQWAAKELGTVETAEEPEEMEEPVTLGEKVEQLNQTAQLFNKKLHFEIHEETQRIMVQVMYADSGEVIREIPPQRILDLLARIEQELGILLDEQL